MMSEREKALQVENERLRLELEHKHRSDESKLLEEIKAVKKLTEDQNVVLKKIDLTLNGAPNHPEQGMVVRMDRLEQKDKDRTWRERVTLTVIIGLVVKAFYSLLKGN